MQYQRFPESKILNELEQGHEKKCEKDVSIEYLIAMITFLEVCLVPVILISNFIVIVTSILVPNLRKASDNILFGLAVTDLFFGLISIPMYIINNIPEIQWLLPSTQIMCFFDILAATIPGDISFTLLCLLSFDRFLAINWPFRYMRLVTRPRMSVAVVFVFIAVATKNVVSHIIVEENFNASQDGLENRCYGKHDFGGFHNFQDVNFIEKAILMIVTLCFCIQVSYIASKQTQRTSKAQGLLHLPENRSKSLTIILRKGHLLNVKLTVYLMFAFIVLWLPIFCRPIVHMYCTPCCCLVYTKSCALLVILNGSMNAFIYAFTRQSYKIAYKYLITTPPCRWANVRDVIRLEAFNTSISTSRRNASTPPAFLSERFI